MERIIIIGCGGAGKSTLARNLGEKTGIPVIHLDQIFWAPGNWVHVERPVFDAKLAEALEEERWIMDGNFNRTMEMRLAKCDTVIYLDFNHFTCLRSWMKRVITHWGTHRSDMAPGCNEWFDPEFAAWIWKYNKRHRKQNYETIARYPHVRLVVLKNRRQVRKFLEEVGK